MHALTQLLDQMERRIGWLAFPSIIRYLAYFQLGVVALSLFRPGATELLTFDWNMILEGQVWRLLSFICIPVGALAGSSGTVTLIFSIFAALLLMSFGDGLEARWGSFRTTIFFLGGWLVCLLVSILYSTLLGYHDADGKLLFAIPTAIPPGMLFDYAILFAFATYYPRFELRLFLVFPVPIFIIAIIGGISILLFVSMGVPFLIYSLLCLSHYLIVAVPMLLNRGKRMQHTVKHQARSRKQPTHFHECAICGIKDTDDDTMGFRVRASDGLEVCDRCREQAQK